MGNILLISTSKHTEVLLLPASNMSSSVADLQDIPFQTAHITDNRQPETRAAQIACLVIAYVGVALRFLARRLAKAQITSDDYVIVLALVVYRFLLWIE